MSFTKLLVENEEPSVLLGRATFFLYAIGPEGNAFGYHVKRGAICVNFDQDGKPTFP
jgi:hypothetical protein